MTADRTPLDRLDRALIPAKAVLNLLPLGGFLSSLIADCMTQSQQEAVKRAAELLQEKVDQLEGRIDIEVVNKDDLAELLGKYEALATTTKREEKLRAASNIVANALLPPGDPNRSSFDELDHLMHCVGALSSGAIAFLGAAMQAASVQAPKNGRFSFADITFRLPGIDPDVVMGLASELRSFNLLHINEGQVGGPDPKRYGFQVTPVGVRFAQRFVEGRM